MPGGVAGARLTAAPYADQLDMSIILPYVVWITLLAFAMDWTLKVISRKAFPWYFGRNGEAQG